MINIDTTYYPLVVIQFKPSEWKVEDFYVSRDYIVELVHASIDRGKKITLFFIGNKSLVDPPPWTYYMRVARAIVENAEVLRVGTERTAVYQPDDQIKRFIDYLLMVFTPKNPFMIFTDLDEACDWLHDNGVAPGPLKATRDEYIRSHDGISAVSLSLTT